MDLETGNSVGLTTGEALSRLRHDIETVLDEYEEFQAKRYAVICVMRYYTTL
jgi:hypothetical protein